MLVKVLCVLIWLYQRSFSVLLRNRCRFYPSCSHYAITALERYGLWHGGRLVVSRIKRCNPWQLGGVDHVPK
ncbi:MAG: hypothetical protein RLZ12_1013 [Bacillota bacterium]|jgi:putative membrane protein insertion efficiency factor